MRKANFPWTYAMTELLLNIYGENIDKFLSKYKKQTVLWSKLVNQMKEDPKMPPNLKNDLTPLIAQRKMISLQQNFKSLFYCKLKPNSKIPGLFPFYDKMLAIFTDYAKAQLNKTIENGEESLNETSERDISAFISGLLGNEDQKVVDKENQSNITQSSPSVSSKFIRKLKVVPKDSLSITSPAKLPVDPNTPFNRKYQLKTIQNYRNYNPNTLKRRNYESLWPEVKKQSSSGAKVSVLEDITIRGAFNSTEYEADSGAMWQGVSGGSNSVEFVKNIGGTVLEVSDNSKKTKSGSSFEVPDSFDFSIDELRCEAEDVPRTRITESFLEKIPSRPMPRRLNMDSLVEEEPPRWFQSFVAKHDMEVKQINEKIDQINAKLKIIVQRKSISLVNPVITKLQREF